MRLAKFNGPTVPHVEERIAEILELWHAHIPGEWTRGPDARLLDPYRRYCRSNYREESIRRGEHAIEYDLLNRAPTARTTQCLGARLVDGVNAVPLAKDSAGGRRGNVEADMLLLVKDEREDEHRLLLVEVKVKSNNAWFAVVENLRQLRLFSESIETQRLFIHRHPELELSESLPVAGLVLAPATFFSAPGAKATSLPPAQTLLERMRLEAGVDARFATW